MNAAVLPGDFIPEFDNSSTGSLPSNQSPITRRKDRSMFRSSRQEVFCKKGVLRNFAKFTGKHLCQSLFFNKVAGLRSADLQAKSTKWFLYGFYMMGTLVVKSVHKNAC